ncbi:hypothetical protein Ssi03_62590 [Sphaerisporangium siamense]|uniref:Bacteriophage Mu GpT domain-containing protein n=1 Tax=Sphaerisporangium siamense TaxID=795645 RepID=A0A7W7D977_9ACTN|nr:hypothetical protein [Sphaerisporangium siamense]MBB4702567.1 hypothetical protein [Sphaerisporangium siamense]GII88269.1 hypothetical protein Ssi03_62590 [Sphaerisporangium siamense]
MTYTTHGHWIGAGPPIEPSPQLVARCGGPGVCGQCNQEAATAAFHGSNFPASMPVCPTCGQTVMSVVRVTESTSAPERPATEAMIDGARSFDDIRELVRRALRERLRSALGSDVYVWVYISDLTTTAVVYAAGDDDLYQCDYMIDAAGEVTLGDPVKVVRTYAPSPAGAPAAEPDDGAAELVETDRVAARADARVIEAKGSTPDGGRIYRVRMIEAGDSKNGRRYPQAVLAAAAARYEGAKAYDRHRDLAELKSGTIVGLVGAYRSVEAADDGLYADLHLLPSATHAAEALDAALAGQAEGLDPLIGLSHDVYATFKSVTENGVQLQEATAITKVNSVDLVSDPAAGGKASRVVANVDPTETGAEPDEAKEAPVPATKEEILAAFKDATDEELAAVGLAKAATTETTTPTPPAPPKQEEQKAVEVAQPKGSFLGQLLIRSKVEDAGLPASAVEAVAAALPDMVTESAVDAQIATVKSGLAILERASLTPTVTVKVTQEDRDKKVAALDSFFSGNFSEGFNSFRQAFVEITGRQPKSWDEDFSRTMLRESFGGGFDSGFRAEESLDSGSWAQVLGDSITRRMMAMYQLPNLQSWRRVVSSIVPVNDFRTQRIGRIGGYGSLPVVNEGAPYQPLTSPGDEEATYAINKKGGTEDLTLEMIANDDVRKISQIPTKLGRAAAQTLLRFVWGFLSTNATCTYDGTALFHASHGNNITTSVLSQSALTVARRRMREQVAYGDPNEVLDNTPRLLIVPSALEELAWTLVTSAVSVGAATTDAELSRTAPNLHQSMEFLVLSFLTDPSDWFLSADPQAVPTLEIGFYLGRQDPELFTQADATSGSMFNADKMTLKIRHIYSGTILDHRGLYAGYGVA